MTIAHVGMNESSQRFTDWKSSVSQLQNTTTCSNIQCQLQMKGLIPTCQWHCKDFYSYIYSQKKKTPLTPQNSHEMYKVEHPQRNKQHSAVFTLLDEKQRQAS